MHLESECNQNPERVDAAKTNFARLKLTSLALLKETQAVVLHRVKQTQLNGIQPRKCDTKICIFALSFHRGVDLIFMDRR